jgi:hypothetical protein
MFKGSGGLVVKVSTSQPSDCGFELSSGSHTRVHGCKELILPVQTQISGI